MQGPPCGPQALLAPRPPLPHTREVSPMPVRGALLALLLTGLALPAAELHTLKGDKITGDLVRVTDKEIVLIQDGKEVATPVVGVLQLEFPGNSPARLDEKYVDVELTDGTLLHCKEV